MLKEKRLPAAKTKRQIIEGNKTFRQLREDWKTLVHDVDRAERVVAVLGEMPGKGKRYKSSLAALLGVNEAMIRRYVAINDLSEAEKALIRGGKTSTSVLEQSDRAKQLTTVPAESSKKEFDLPQDLIDARTKPTVEKRSESQGTGAPVTKPGLPSISDKTKVLLITQRGTQTTTSGQEDADGWPGKIPAMGSPGWSDYQHYLERLEIEKQKTARLGFPELKGPFTSCRANTSRSRPIVAVVVAPSHKGRRGLCRTAPEPSLGHRTFTGVPGGLSSQFPRRKYAAAFT